MTLVITEVSGIGIVMAADSAISYFDRQTRKVVKVESDGGPKVLRVPSINAAISYWGMVGAVTEQQFSLWLRKLIDSRRYSDLNSFSDLLVVALNEACKGKLLKDDESVGIHVAGYALWSDGEQRPTFIHIHNGHGQFVTIPQGDEDGNLVALYPRWITYSRKLFEKHQDFPAELKSLEENLEILRQGYITRNGDFYIYAVIWEAMEEAFKHINLTPNFQVPSNPLNLGSRKDYLQMAVEIIVRIYSCSNHKQKPTIAGEAVSLGIGPRGYLTPISKGIG
jgi:hypothetical protein